MPTGPRAGSSRRSLWSTSIRCEPAAANIVRAGRELIYPDAFPRTRERLERVGFRVRTVDVSELAKAEGAVTCCSLIFDAVL